MTMLKMLTGVRTPNKSTDEDCCVWEDTNQVTHVVLEVDVVKKVVCEAGLINSRERSQTMMQNHRKRDTLHTSAS